MSWKPALIERIPAARAHGMRSAPMRSGATTPSPLREMALVGVWEQLDAQSELPTQRRDFHDALAQTMLAGARIALVTAGRAGRIDAIAPLCRNRGWFARWRLMGAQEVFEPVAPLCRDAGAATLLARKLARLRRPSRFDRVPVDSPILFALRKAVRGRGVVVERPAKPCPTMVLDAGWIHPEERFNAGRRSDFRRAARRAADIGEIACEVITPDSAHFDSLFDEAVAIEACGWKTQEGSAISADPAKHAFFRAWLRGACANGSLRIAFLRIGGKAVAMQFALVGARRYWLLKIGYDEAYARCSPGNLLMLHTIGWAAREGLQSFEFLGEDEPWIAALWTQAVRDCVSLRLYPWSLRGLGWLAFDSVTWLRTRFFAARPA